MDQWKLSFQEPALFTCELSIRVTDLNYGNHLGNDRIVGLMHEARMQFLQSYGYTEMNIEGVGLILRDLSVVLKKEMFYGDSLKVEISVPQWSATGFRIEYRFLRLENNQSTVTALAHTTMVCYDYAKRKPARVPDPLLAHCFLR